MKRRSVSQMNRVGAPSVSIVIPVYNEEDHLAACLDAIAVQSVKPLEVIVVDNNSTDATVAIASRYSFVKILHEPRQGVVFARDCGFNAASGEILGRLDADSVISPDWVETVQRLFSEDPELAITSGRISYYDISWSQGLNSADLFVRRRFARLLGRYVAVQAANMAMRRSTWTEVRNGGLCYRGGLHEDFDLSIHASQQGFRVTFDERLRAAISARMIDRTPLNFLSYVWLSPKTYALHGVKSRFYIYPAVFASLLFYWPLRMMYRGYDKQEKRFSFKTMMGVRANSRVNPATFVD